MLFRLARDLSRTVNELTRTISHAEFVEWLAFYQVEAEAQAKANRDAQRRK